VGYAHPKNKMQFQSNILLLTVVSKDFTNSKGETIAYTKATFISEKGEVFGVTTSKEVLDTLGNKNKLEGVGSFEVGVDFKGYPRLKLIAFIPKKA